MEQQNPQGQSNATAPTPVQTPLPPVAPTPPPAMPAPVTPPSVTPPPVIPTPPVTPPETPKSSSPWPWIVGGCLLIVIIITAAVLFLGWWGIREAKKEINNRVDKYEPTVDEIKANVDRINKEGEEWEKISKEFRESMPSEEDFPKLLDDRKL